MPIIDLFETHAPSLDGPAIGGFDIAPDDQNDLPKLTRALMVSTLGDVTLTLQDGSTLTLAGLAPGQVYPLRAGRVLATGTSATGIKGLY